MTMSPEAHELSLFIENDRNLHFSQEVPIQKNLATKSAKGEYKHDLAVKMYGYLIEAGAKKYAKEHLDSASAWSRHFPPPVRKEVAEAFARSFEAECALGNYAHLLPKKYQQVAKKPAATARKRR